MVFREAVITVQYAEKTGLADRVPRFTMQREPVRPESSFVRPVMRPRPLGNLQTGHDHLVPYLRDAAESRYLFFARPLNGVPPLSL